MRDNADAVPRLRVGRLDRANIVSEREPLSIHGLLDRAAWEVVSAERCRDDSDVSHGAPFSGSPESTLRAPCRSGSIGVPELGTAFCRALIYLPSTGRNCSTGYVDD